MGETARGAGCVPPPPGKVAAARPPSQCLLIGLWPWLAFILILQRAGSGVQDLQQSRSEARTGGREEVGGWPLPIHRCNFGDCDGYLLCVGAGRLLGLTPNSPDSRTWAGVVPT